MQSCITSTMSEIANISHYQRLKSIDHACPGNDDTQTVREVGTYCTTRHSMTFHGIVQQYNYCTVVLLRCLTYKYTMLSVPRLQTFNTRHQ